MSVKSGGTPPGLGSKGAITGLGESTSGTNPTPMDIPDQAISAKNPNSQLTKGLTGSIQNIIVDPSQGKVSDIINSQKAVQKEICLYERKDIGPFRVYIENNALNFKGKLSASKVGDIIYTCHVEIDNKIKEIESVGRNRVQLILKDYLSANLLVKSDKLKKYNLEAYVPRFLLRRKGVIYNVDEDYSEEQLKNKIKPFDSHCNFTLESVKRIMKKTFNEQTKESNLSPSKTVIVTFNSQILPQYVAMSHVRYKVKPYVQKVVLCYNCWRYGHLASQCKSKLRCLKCGNNHNSNECDSEDPIKCFYCDSIKHTANETKKCPEFERQKQIKKYMSNQNVSYKEAAKSVPKKTYANIAALGSDININEINNVLGNSSISQRGNTGSISSKFTYIGHQTKRPRPQSPNPTNEERNRILSDFRQTQTTVNLLNDNIYMSNTRSSQEEKNQSVSHLNENAVLDLVMYVVNTLKEKKSFDFGETDILKLIKNKSLLHPK